MGTNDTKEIAPLAATNEAKAELLNSIRDKYRGDSRESQRIRLHAALRRFAISTLEARKYLDIMHPAGRVQELRDEGCNVVTYRATEETGPGLRHRVGVYVLVKGDEQ